MPGKLKVTQIKSTISHIARNRATVKALGLHGIGSSVEVVDNDATRGMVRQVRFLVTVEEVGEGKHPVAAQASPRQGADEHESERTNVRERASADGNAGAGRISGDGQEKA
jgi:large subunit ribosomal protein L30